MTSIGVRLEASLVTIWASARLKILSSANGPYGHVVLTRFRLLQCGGVLVISREDVHVGPECSVQDSRAAFSSHFSVWSTFAGGKGKTGGRYAARRRPRACGAAIGQTLEGSFSAVSKPDFASKYALVTRCYAKQYEVVLRCMSPCSVCIEDFFQLKMLRIFSHWKY